VRRCILRSFQSPGDVAVLTAAVRDLHAAYPGQFETDVRYAAIRFSQRKTFVNAPGIIWPAFAVRPPKTVIFEPS
jgi:hypothetical protein